MTQELDGYFPIARVSAEDISYETFYEKYFLTEQPLIIENVGRGWPALECWSAEYLVAALSQEPTAKQTAFWYWLDSGGMQKDYVTPPIVDELSRSSRIFPRETHNLRIWVHRKGHVTHWHYDHNMVNVFNVQITGSKDWILISPENPPIFYPFTNFSIIGPRDEEVYSGRRHTRFKLKTGDMLYMPQLWVHKVYARDDENISLNWLMTSNESNVQTRGLERELERYTLQRYFSNNRYAFVRNSFDHFHSKLPDYLRMKWRYPELVKSPYRITPYRLIIRMFKETIAFLSMLRYIKYTYQTNVSGDPVKPFIKE